MSGKRTITAVTAAQQAVLDYIDFFTGHHKYPPTLQEIQNRFHWRSATAARKHLEALKFKGCVTWEPRKARTLRVVQQEEAK